VALREQLNLRLPPEWFEVLTIAAMYQDQSAADFVRGILEREVARLRDDPDIADVRHRKAERSGERDGSVTRLEGRRKEAG
jgi:hypothetical protein